MSRAGRITRRVFLGTAGAAAAGLAIGYYFYRRPFPNPLEAHAAEGEAVFSPFVKIAADGPITIIVPRAEMGQGVTTTLAALVAEELDVRLDQIAVEHGPAASAYANIGMLQDAVPFPRFDDSATVEMLRSGMGVVGKFLAIQGTGGSSSAIDAFERMRHAGALAREALKAEAARRWNVEASSLTTADATVANPASGEEFSYADLAVDAASVAYSGEPGLRPASAWTLLGRAQPRLDMEAKSTGAPIFGIDVALPDMVYGTVRMNPVLGGRMRGFNAAAAEAMPGVLKVVEIDTHLGHGVGIIARSTWHAFRAAEAVEIEWEGASADLDDAAVWERLEDAVSHNDGSTFRDDGEVDTAFADAPRERIVEAEYRVPFLAHATLEPMNATARFRDGRLHVWAPNQAPTLVRMACAREAGIAQDRCTIHTTSLGGGFGRRLETDYAVYATRLAMEAGGRPVKVTWTREEDTTHDTYRPAAIGRFRARIGEDGLPQALDMKIASPSIIASMLPRLYPSLSAMGADAAIVDGSYNQPYTIPDYRVAGIKADIGLPLGFWRSVGNSYNGFFHEAFMDEIATAGGIDPVELRRRLMAEYPTALGVVEKVAEMANWSAQTAPNRAKGFAFATSFGSWVAEIVEVSEDSGRIRVEKIWIAADVGIALDPGIVETQLMSGALFGLSAAMFEEIGFEGGRAVQTNFDDYEPLRIHQSPQVEIAILQTASKMGGVGEVGTPPAAPALANAIFALTGRRVRRLPLAREVTFA